MTTLAIDTSTDLGTFAISKGDSLVSELTLGIHREELADLIPIIDFFLKKNSLLIGDIDLFVIGLGPGSWTGIRVSVTTLKSVAHSLNKPIVGICSLDLLAYNIRFSCYPVCTIIDTTRGEVYYARYDCSKNIPVRTEDYNIAPVEELLAKVKEPTIFIGNGVKNYFDKFKELEKENLLFHMDSINYPKASCLLEAGLSHYKKHGADDVFEIVPLYLQKISAEIEWDFKNSKK